MILRGFNREPLITEEMALEIAKLVFIREFGSDDFERQQPLTVQDEGDSWVIEGSREYDEDAPRDHYQLVDGRTLIEIAKENGAILALEKLSAFADPKGPTRQLSRFRLGPRLGERRLRSAPSPPIVSSPFPARGWRRLSPCRPRG